MSDKITFAWKNYFRPTPPNLEYFATKLRLIFSAVAGSTVLLESNRWVPFWIIVVGAVLDVLKDFFAKASADYNDKVSINVPPAMADKVEITDKVDPKEDETRS
jgi:hypothetical protein